MELLLIKKLIAKKGNLKLINLSSLNNDDLILPTAFVGPIMGKENLLNEKAFNVLLYEFKKHYGKLPAAIMPGEIGGANGLFPLIMSAITDIPILDGDLLGRAFPEVQMASPNVIGDVSCAPTFLISEKGAAEILLITNIKEMEKAARSIAEKWGGCAIIGVYCMNVLQAKSSIIKGSITKAIKLGDIINSDDNVLSKLCNFTNGEVIFTGKVKSIKRDIIKGFLTGNIEIVNKRNQNYKIFYKNEYLVAYYGKNIVAKTPDVISILDATSYTPITSEKLLLEEKVLVLTCPSDNIWYTKKGLKLVGLEAHKLFS